MRSSPVEDIMETYDVVVMMRTSQLQIRSVTFVFTDRETAEVLYSAAKEAVSTIYVYLIHKRKQLRSDLGAHYETAIQ